MIVLLVSGSLNLSDIVIGQSHGFFASYGFTFLSWNWIPLFPIFVVYIICSIAETGRHPFDTTEGESEIVAGHMVEYSGMAFAMFYLAEYANIVLFSTMAAIMFLGGWLAPVNWSFLAWVPGWICFQDVHHRFHIHLGSGDIPALPLRSCNAAWLEGADSAYTGLPRFHRLLDADAFQYMAMRQSG